MHNAVNGLLKLTFPLLKPVSYHLQTLVVTTVYLLSGHWENMFDNASPKPCPQRSRCPILVGSSVPVKFQGWPTSHFKPFNVCTGDCRIPGTQATDCRTRAYSSSTVAVSAQALIPATATTSPTRSSHQKRNSIDLNYPLLNLD